MANEKNLKKFTSEYQPENRGRKKNIYTQLQASNLTKTDIINLFRFVLEQSPQQLKEDYDKIKTIEKIKESDNKPILYYNLVAAIFRDLKKGSLTNIMSILTRWLGHPQQTIGISGDIDINKFDIELTSKERQDYKERMKSFYKDEIIE
jgi:hypothetical protein